MCPFHLGIPTYLTRSSQRTTFVPPSLFEITPTTFPLKSYSDARSTATRSVLGTESPKSFSTLTEARAIASFLEILPCASMAVYNEHKFSQPIFSTIATEDKRTQPTSKRRFLDCHCSSTPNAIVMLWLKRTAAALFSVNGGPGKILLALQL